MPDGSNRNHAKQLEVLRNIDRLCDTFEHQLCEGQTLQLDMLLNQVPEDHQDRLLKEFAELVQHHGAPKDLQVQLQAQIDQRPEVRDLTIGGEAEETTDRSKSPPHSLVLESKRQTALQPGSEFGKFRILEEVARGAMGVVFKAHQKDLNRIVALKIILSGRLAGEAEIRRFRREARSVAALNHPNIVSIYEVDQIEELHYFSMNYFEGTPLGFSEIMHAESLAEKVNVFIQICEAMDYSHKHGIIHRDLKPANILLSPDGNIQIVDFGLAKEFDAIRSELTGDHMVGTPLYMAPEQILGDQTQVGPASDVYAIGVMLYEVTTGKKPFDGTSLFQLMQQIIRVQPDPPTATDAKLPRLIDEICHRCLSKDPKQRYCSAGEIAADLRKLEPSTLASRPNRRFGDMGYPRAITLACLGTIALTSLAIGGLLIRNQQWNGSVPEPTSSAAQTDIAEPFPSPSLPLAPQGPTQDDWALGVIPEPELTIDTFARLQTPAKYQASLRPDGITTIENLPEQDLEYVFFIALNITCPMFKFYQDPKYGPFPLWQEVHKDPTLMTAELESLVRGQFDLPLRITCSDESGAVIETIEKVLYWNDGLGLFEEERWDPDSKNVQTRVICFISGLKITSPNRLSIQVEIDKSVEFNSTVTAAELKIY